MCLFVCFLYIFSTLHLCPLYALYDFIDFVTGSKRADGCIIPHRRNLRVVLLFIELTNGVSRNAESAKNSELALSNADRKNRPDQTQKRPLVVSDSYGKMHVMHLTVRLDKTKKDEKERKKERRKQKM